MCKDDPNAVSTLLSELLTKEILVNAAGGIIRKKRFQAVVRRSVLKIISFWRALHRGFYEINHMDYLENQAAEADAQLSK